MEYNLYSCIQVFNFKWSFDLYDRFVCINILNITNDDTLIESKIKNMFPIKIIFLRSSWSIR